VSLFSPQTDEQLALVIAWAAILISLASLSMNLVNFRKTARHARRGEEQKDEDWVEAWNQLFMGKPRLLDPPPTPDTVPMGLSEPITPVTPRPYAPAVSARRVKPGECGLCDNGEGLRPGDPCPWCKAEARP
jgi:hypothetical protein